MISFLKHQLAKKTLQNFADIKYHSIKSKNKHRICILMNVTFQSGKMNHFNLLSALYVPGSILDTFLSKLLLTQKKTLTFRYIFQVVQSISGNYFGGELS